MEIIPAVKIDDFNYPAPRTIPRWDPRSWMLIPQETFVTGKSRSPSRRIRNFNNGGLKIFCVHPSHVFSSCVRQSCASVPPRRIRVFSSGLKFRVHSSHALLPPVSPSCISVLPAVEPERMCFCTSSTTLHIRSTSGRNRAYVFSHIFDWCHR